MKIIYKSMGLFVSGRQTKSGITKYLSSRWGFEYSLGNIVLNKKQVLNKIRV